MFQLPLHYNTQSNGQVKIGPTITHMNTLILVVFRPMYPAVVIKILFFCSALVSNSRFVSKCANILCSHLLISFFLAVQFRMSKAMKTKSPLLRCTPMKQVRKLHNLDCTLSAVVCSSRNIIASCVVPSPQLCAVVFEEETSLYAQYLTEYRKHSNSQS